MASAYSRNLRMDLGIQQPQARAADEPTDHGRGGKDRRRTQRRFQDRPGGDHFFLVGKRWAVSKRRKRSGLDLLPRKGNGKVLKRQIRINSGWGVGERSDSNRLRPLQGQSSDAPQSPANSKL